MIFKGKAESVKTLGDASVKSGEKEFFVPFVWENEDIEFEKITPERGRLLRVLTPAPERVTPSCPYFSKCGGCKFQHIAYDSYLAWKQKILKETLAQRGFSDVKINPIVKIPERTRRRVTFNSVASGASHWFGFNGEKSKNVVSLKSCLLLTPELEAFILPLKKLCGRITGDVAVTQADNGFDVLITADKYPDFAFLEILGEFSQENKVLRWAYRNREISPAEIILQNDVPRVGFSGVSLPIPVGAFLQPSREGEAALTSIALDGLSGYNKILDLFCGVGSFTIPLARANEKSRVSGYDVFAPAISALRNSGLANLGAETRDLFQTPLSVTELNSFDAVLLDPPRAGAMAQVEQLAAARLEKIVYISCNPATFARDAKILTAGGYSLQSLTPVDQFIYSPHLELAAEFVRD